MMLSLLLPLAPLLSSPAPATSPADDLARYWEVVALAQEGRPRWKGDGEAQAIRAQLAALALPGLQVEEQESLTSVVDVIRTLTGLPLLVTPDAEEAVLDEGVVFDFALTQELRVDEALDLIARHASEVIDWQVRNGAIVFSTTEGRADTTLFVHSLLDLRVDPYAFGLDPESPGAPLSPIDPDDLLVLIQEHVAPGSWELEDRALDHGNGFLTVLQTPEVQAEVAAFLDELRRFWVPGPTEGRVGAARTLIADDGGRSKAARQLLASIEVPARFGGGGEGAPIEDVAEFLSEVSGLNFVVHPAVLDELDEEETAVELNAQGNLLALLDQIQLVTRGLTWRMDGGVVEFLPENWTSVANALAFRDVRALIEPLALDEDRGEYAVLSEDHLIDLIFRAVRPGSWDDDPRLSVHVLPSGVLVVHHADEAIAEIDAILGELHELAVLKHRVRAKLGR